MWAKPKEVNVFKIETTVYHINLYSYFSVLYSWSTAKSELIPCRESISACFLREAGHVYSFIYIIHSLLVYGPLS